MRTISELGNTKMQGIFFGRKYRNAGHLKITKCRNASHISDGKHQNASHVCVKKCIVQLRNCAVFQLGNMEMHAILKLRNASYV